MKIDTKIRQAIRLAAKNVGNVAQLSRVTGVNEANFSRYLGGKVKSIEHDTWAKLEPLLRPYLGEPEKPVCLQLMGSSLSRRDYYVCAVMQGILASGDKVDPEEIVGVADAVMAEADKTKKED